MTWYCYKEVKFMDATLGGLQRAVTNTKVVCTQLGRHAKSQNYILSSKREKRGSSRRQIMRDKTCMSQVTQVSAEKNVWPARQVDKGTLGRRRSLLPSCYLSLLFDLSSTLSVLLSMHERRKTLVTRKVRRYIPAIQLAGLLFTFCRTRSVKIRSEIRTTNR